MALPGYNSNVGHETPSLLDAVLGAMDSAWQTGTDWLEEKGTAVKEAGTEFLESYPETDSPYKDGRDWNQFTEEEKEKILSGGDEMTETAFNWMGGGLGTLVRKGGGFIKPLPKIGDLGKEAVKKHNSKPAAPGTARFGRENFKFKEGANVVETLSGANTEQEVRYLFNALKHQYSNYDDILDGTLGAVDTADVQRFVYKGIIEQLEAAGKTFQVDVLKKMLKESQAKMLKPGFRY